MDIKDPHRLVRLGYKLLVGYTVGDEFTVLAGSDEVDRAKEAARQWSRTMRGTEIAVYHADSLTGFYPTPLYVATAPSDKGVPLPRPQNAPPTASERGLEIAIEQLSEPSGWAFTDG